MIAKHVSATVLAAVTMVCAGLAAVAPAPSASATPATASGLVSVWRGPAHELGNGSVRNEVVSLASRVPVSIGVVFDAASLTGLPTDPPTDGMHCYDVDGNHVIDPMSECMGGYEQRLTFPATAATTPYTYTMLNWNPMGHTAPIYNVPHFDFHFYFSSQAATDAIRMGPCSELINCDDFVTAIKPLPAKYMPAQYTDVQGAEGMMGDHMADLSSPEFTPAGFSRTLIYGKYDAKLTFIEPMITVAYFKSLATRTQLACQAIPQPRAWQKAGWYPRSYCVGYDAAHKQYRVLLTDFRRG